MLARHMSRFSHRWFLALLVTFSALPVLAQSSMSLSPGQQATASGTTAGSVSLSSIRNRGDNGKFCLGYGNDVPDHTLNVTSNASSLNLQVTSKGDTMLLVQTPDGKVYCGGANLAVPQASQGSYRIWLGSGNAGQRHRYTLTVK